MIKVDNAPSARSGHSAAANDTHMYVFGGKDNDDCKLNDLWCLNLQTEQWELLSANIAEHNSDHPIGRQGHTSVLYNGHLVIFGGIYETTRELNDVYAYNLSAKKWRVLFRNPQDELKVKEAADSSQKKQRTMRGDSPDATNTQSLKNTLNKNKTKKPEVKKPKVIDTNKEEVQHEVKLESPTSVTMKQSFLLKQSDQEFEGYWNHVKKMKPGMPACTQAFNIERPSH